MRILLSVSVLLGASQSAFAHTDMGLPATSRFASARIESAFLDPAPIFALQDADADAAGEIEAATTPEALSDGRIGVGDPYWFAAGAELPITPFFRWSGGVALAAGWVEQQSSNSFRELEFNIGYALGKASDDVDQSLDTLQGDRPGDASSLSASISYNFFGGSSWLRWEEDEIDMLLGAGIGMGITYDEYEWDDYNRVAGTRTFLSTEDESSTLGYGIINAMVMIDGPGFIARIELPAGLRFTQPFSHNFGIRVLVGFSF